MTETEEAGSHGFPQRTRMSRIEYLRRSNELDRQKNPHLYVQSADGLGAKWLFLENVAAMLGTTEDFVYRIGREDLPAARIGKRSVYSRDDIDAFISKQIEVSRPRYVAERKVHVISQETAAGAKPASSGTFDPIATLHKLGIGK
ncbi:helix-turn-helix domain-containing protein [Rhizobium leguminosarum]|uniref:helix-turn-helix domain-containing protein n=1 Tax=Rhizobium leguminosarum TaxID=384 RepID=UPI00140F5B1B|nr:helix-turn-helix domain-containing protein [Rhizobium leguminosarum]QIO59983.1 helix-turn-helix domain-containing protein [Rhizobium leguminosarum bv. trifolii]